MPETGFIAWRKWIQSVAAVTPWVDSEGVWHDSIRLSNRQACAMVMPVATHFGLIDNGLPTQPPHGDPTGELVITAVLKGVRVTDLLPA